MGEKNQQRDYGLSCLTWRDKDTKVYISHCLNYDLMETGSTLEESRKNLNTVIKHHIEHCYSRYPAGPETFGTSGTMARILFITPEESPGRSG